MLALRQVENFRKGVESWMGSWECRISCLLPCRQRILALVQGIPLKNSIAYFGGRLPWAFVAQKLNRYVALFQETPMGL
ncbi:hypothetical protein EJB05_24627, partial [Eragrostis curvula]